MYKKLFNLMVLMITVLTVNLLTGFITEYIIHYELGLDPYKFTAIAMLALVFILVPAFSYLNRFIELTIARFLVSGSNSFGKTLGLLFSFAAVFSILFCIYLYQWFGINVIEVTRAYLSYH